MWLCDSILGPLLNLESSNLTNVCVAKFVHNVYILCAYAKMIYIYIYWYLLLILIVLLKYFGTKILRRKKNYSEFFFLLGLFVKLILEDQSFWVKEDGSSILVTIDTQPIYRLEISRYKFKEKNKIMSDIRIMQFNLCESISWNMRKCWVSLTPKNIIPLCRVRYLATPLNVKVWSL